MEQKATLLISTYNWPEALELVLLSILKQTTRPLEVIIADDGSTEVTKNLINNFKKESSFPIKHVWHKDTGFNRTSILNKAIAASTGDYIIQTDGDCILHPNFIEDHVRLASKNTYLYGSRVTIKEDFLKFLFKNKVIDFHFLSKGIKKRTRALRVPFLSKLYSSNKEVSKKIRGCNISFWKQDFIEVNGYDEDMTGWGREDSELIYRMVNKCCVGKRVRYSGIVYHIWHKTVSKNNLNRNDIIQQNTIENKVKKCNNGIDKYLKAFK